MLAPATTTAHSSPCRNHRPLVAPVAMTAIFVAALAVQVGYWMLIRLGLIRASAEQIPFRDEPATGGALPPMTVVVAARNEEQHLHELLTALARQSHPNHEIIIVDDGSTDRTPEILAAWSARLDLKVIRADGCGKKRALTRGIEAASHDLLAFTDADCVPPPDWLRSLAAAHAATEESTLLIGYSPFRGSGNPVELVASYETFATGILTTAAAGLGRPYMAVGRNISYPREVFRQVGGFDPIMHSLSGDDDLFVQEVARARAARIRTILDPRSFVPTPAPATWGEWLRQKRRHTSAGRYYRPQVQVHLALFHGSGILIWLAPCFLGWMGAALLALRLIAQIAVTRNGARMLHETRLLPALPLLEPAYILYNALVAPLGLMKLPGRW